MICDYEDELFDIYKEVRKSAVRVTIKNMVRIDKGADPYFDTHKSKLNRVLIDTLGKTLADFYLITKVVIEDGIHVYKIDLEEKYIKIDPKG